MVQGGLGLPDLRAEVPQQLAASKLIITARVDSIILHNTLMASGKRFKKELQRHDH